MFGGCKGCKALEEHNRYLQKIIDSLLKHVGADQVMEDRNLAEQIPELIEDHEGSDNPAEVYGE